MLKFMLMFFIRLESPHWRHRVFLAQHQKGRSLWASNQSISFCEVSFIFLDRRHFAEIQRRDYVVTLRWSIKSWTNKRRSSAEKKSWRMSGEWFFLEMLTLAEAFEQTRWLKTLRQCNRIRNVLVPGNFCRLVIFVKQFLEKNVQAENQNKAAKTSRASLSFYDRWCIRPSDLVPGLMSPSPWLSEGGVVQGLAVDEVGRRSRWIRDWCNSVKTKVVLV